jgi:hypothetical protein
VLDWEPYDERPRGRVARRNDARLFREALTEHVRYYDEHGDFAALGPHAEREIEISFADGRCSQHWFTIPIKWAVLLELSANDFECADKDRVMFVPGPLMGGTTLDGTRKLKVNVPRLHCVVLDYDKGDAPLEKLVVRMKELKFQCGMYATFSHLKEKTELAWSVKHRNPKTRQMESKPTVFQNFARSKLGVDNAGEIDAALVTGEIAKAFMIEQQDFDCETIGEVVVLDNHKVDGARHAVLVKHNPIAKSRLIVPLAEPFVRGLGESEHAFQTRWEEQVYFPLGRLIGLKFDAACASTERGHYIMTRREGTERVPIQTVRSGRLLDLNHPEIDGLLAPLRGPLPNKRTVKAPGRRKSGTSSTQRYWLPNKTTADWRGFLAADAAAVMLDCVTDKRGDQHNPLVAFPCPFVHEHATSNNRSAHQCYAYNAGALNRLPVIKCQSDTCRDRPYAEFLEELFDEDVKRDPQWRLSTKRRRPERPKIDWDNQPPKRPCTTTPNINWNV